MKENIIPIENKKPIEEVKNLEEQELSVVESFSSSVFNYDLLTKTEKLCVRLSGTDKENARWQAREIQEADMPNYKKLLTNSKVVKYFCQERPWTDDEIKEQVNEWVNDYDKKGRPLGALTISSEQGDFMGYALGFVKERGIAEIDYAFFPEYWGKGIGYSVLSKMVEEWSSEVRRIGLGKGLEESNERHQRIAGKFQCFGGKVLKRLCVAIRPINISSWSIAEKTGFKPTETGVINLNNPIDFNERGFELPVLDNLFDYYSKIEYYIEKLYRDNDIEIDRPYHMIDNNRKLYTFDKKSDGRIRFHYEKEVE